MWFVVYMFCVLLNSLLACVGIKFVVCSVVLFLEGVVGLRYTRLGRFRVSVVGVGAWQAGMRLWGGGGLDRGVFVDVYRYAFDQGVNLIDTAEIYGWGRSERVVGEAVRGWGGDVVVATKIAGCFFSPRWIRRRLMGSLERLGLSRVPLYQVHWPPSIYTDLCGGMRVLGELVDEGLVDMVGLSNFPAPLFEKAVSCLSGGHRVVSDQVEYSLVRRAAEKRLQPVLERHGARLLAWGPLAKGALAGKTRIDNLARLLDPSFHRARRDKRLQETLAEIAGRHGVSKATVALAWIISKNIIPLVGVRSRRHVDTLVEAAELNLHPEDKKQLDQATQKYTKGDITKVTSRLIPNTLLCTTLWLTRGA